MRTLHRPRAIAVCCAVIVAALATVPDRSHAHGQAPSAIARWGLGVDVVKVMAATARYHDVDQAIADGYTSTVVCFSSPMGGMGIHYRKAAIASDAVSELKRPELLLYAPWHGRLRLVGVEYFQPDLGQPRPSIMGQPFDGPMAGHLPGQPTHYDLHVWLWSPNPSGLFAQWNPLVGC